MNSQGLGAPRESVSTVGPPRDAAGTAAGPRRRQPCRGPRCVPAAPLPRSGRETGPTGLIPSLGCLDMCVISGFSGLVWDHNIPEHRPELGIFVTCLDIPKIPRNWGLGCLKSQFRAMFGICLASPGAGGAGNGCSAKNDSQFGGRDPNPCPGDPFRGHFPFVEKLLEHKPPLPPPSPLDASRKIQGYCKHKEGLYISKTVLRPRW